MPLRDHFNTTSVLLRWQALHSFWPATIVGRLNAILPKEYYAQPNVKSGDAFEIDVGALERESYDPEPTKGGGAASWTMAIPVMLVETELPEPDEYEINIFSQEEHRLLAAIEIVSPSNKDRVELRRSFVNKCEMLLKNDVCVTIIDVLTTRTHNLYGELMDEVNATQTAISQAPIYAVTCRGQRTGSRWRLLAWEYELAIGGMLPTLPVWIADDYAVPLELELTYEAACRSLRMP